MQQGILTARRSLLRLDQKILLISLPTQTHGESEGRGTPGEVGRRPLVCLVAEDCQGRWKRARLANCPGSAWRAGRPLINQSYTCLTGSTSRSSQPTPPPPFCTSSFSRLPPPPPFPWRHTKRWPTLLRWLLCQGFLSEAFIILSLVLHTRTSPPPPPPIYHHHHHHSFTTPSTIICPN